MTDGSGGRVETTQYLPFGVMREHTGTDLSDYKFTDQERDGSSNLYNYNARLYDPVIGRFISADTLVQAPYNPQSLNRYSYCINNPLIYTDPSGYNWLGDLWSSFWNWCFHSSFNAGAQAEAAEEKIEEAETKAFESKIEKMKDEKDYLAILITWNEMGPHIRPLETFPDGPYVKESEESLKEAISRVLGIAGTEPNRCTDKRALPDSNSEPHRRVWRWIEDLSKNPIAPGRTRHFVIWPSNDGLTPNPGIGEVNNWPYTEKDKITDIYGPYRHNVTQDTNWYFFFYTGVP
jgi:RHS repeat-associated protein